MKTKKLTMWWYSACGAWKSNGKQDLGRVMFEIHGPLGLTKMDQLKRLSKLGSKSKNNVRVDVEDQKKKR